MATSPHRCRGRFISRYLPPVESVTITGGSVRFLRYRLWVPMKAAVSVPTCSGTARPSAYVTLWL